MDLRKGRAAIVVTSVTLFFTCMACMAAWLVVPEVRRLLGLEPSVTPSTPGSIDAVAPIASTTRPAMSAATFPSAPTAMPSQPPAPPIPIGTLEPGVVRVRGVDGAEMVFVPEGEFIMGSDSGHSGVSPSPLHEVYLDAFWIDKTEVTNEQYSKCVDAGVCDAAGCMSDSHVNGPWQPVVCVSWPNAVEYASWVGGRLPTEAEWEKAARGTDGREYPWGDEFDAAKCHSSNHHNYNSTPVGLYSPQGDSPFGVADMAGNVWEWTSSLPWSYPYNPDDDRREDPEVERNRVVRGGSFSNSGVILQCAYRAESTPDYRGRGLGFRVVVSPGPPE